LDWKDLGFLLRFGSLNFNFGFLGKRESFYGFTQEDFRKLGNSNQKGEFSDIVDEG